MPASLRDVAQRAGVSEGTVSHVLNGNTRARISESTQERVRRAAGELGYRPNQMARSLGKGRTGTIGLLISGLKNPFFVEMLEAAETIARELGYQTLTDSAPSVRGTFGGHAPVPTAWPVDGMLVWAMALVEPPLFRTDPASGAPVVYLGGVADRTVEEDRPADCVTFDYVDGGRQVANHLLERGRSHIAYVAPYPFGEGHSDDARHRAFVEYCQGAGLSVELLLTHAEETRAAGERVGAAVAAMPKSQRPDALFCHNDMIAIGVCCGLRRGGVAIPEEISVVGFDGIEEGLYLLDLQLTTVRTSPQALCHCAFEILISRLQGQEEPRGQTVVVPVELRIGGTT